MKMNSSTSQSDEDTPTEQAEQRSYAEYASNTELNFDPMKELNLPSSYEEVTSRFQRLQGSRAMEVLN